MSILQYIAIGLVAAPVAIYLVVRFASAAFFNSKQQYEREKRHEP